MNKTATIEAAPAAALPTATDLTSATGAVAARRAPIDYASQPARAANIEALVNFFESGIKDTPGELGIELEHILVHNDLSPVTYSGEHGVQWVLEQLESAFPITTRDAEGDLIGVARPGEAVTLEPAAQLELSAGPFRSLACAQETFEAFEKRLEGVLGPVGERVLTVGYHPTARAMSLELIPKRRYKFMNLYLGARGKFGPCMMRGSASTQVSIDYSSVDDCLRKLRLAYALVPLFALMCDNSPIFEGKPRSHELVRTEIWKYCDPDRCGVVPGALKPDFDLRRYAEYVLDTPAILVPCKKEEWCYSERTFGEIYAKRVMERSDIEHAVSMFFNDVRLKTYIEIRPADALPVPYAIAYAALIKGLFYASENLDALDELFAGVNENDIAAAKEDLMARGYEGWAYGRPAAELCDRVIMLAQRGLSADERHFLEPLERLVFDRMTLAERTVIERV